MFTDIRGYRGVRVTMVGEVIKEIQGIRGACTTVVYPVVHVCVFCVLHADMRARITCT